jgi:RNA polymerase sigma-54 factor
MRLSLGFEQRQVQKQILAPRMIQSMEILQLPIQELEARIDQELNENPILERQEVDPALPEESYERESSDAPTDSEKELVVDEKANNVDDFERLLDLNREVPDYFDERPRMSSGRIEEMSMRRHDTLANLVTRPTTLQESLQLQLRELEVPAPVNEIALRIISSLDANGYLLVNLEDLLPADFDSAQQEYARRALDVVQSLEPVGVGARSLQECLLLQLTPSMALYTELKTLITHHLDDLKDNRLPQIRKKTGYSFDKIHETWDALRKLNPKPAASFQDIPVQTVTPDVFLDRTDDGKYVVRLEETNMPQLRISNYYRQRLASGNATPEEKEFIKRKVNAAQWLIESIEQRRSTLTKVSQAIIDHQIRFVEEGPEAIEPLKMQQIADKVGVHVTTVSRAVDDKWIQTPRGIFALRNFFVGGTKAADGEDVAWDAIRRKLQEIVDDEDKIRPYSDDDLVKQLAINGLKVARRTVTKYRKKMGIPSSRQRRDWTKTEAAST